MWNVVLVAEQKLQRVRPRREGHFGLGLARTEVQVIEIVRDGLIQGR